MLLCDRCQNTGNVYVLRHFVFDIDVSDIDKFKLYSIKNTDKGIGDIDLCVKCADILNRNLQIAIWATRQNKELKVMD